MYPILNREQWLEAALEQLKLLFIDAGETVFPDIKISMGFPIRKPKYGSFQRGQAFPAEASVGGKTVQIFISPALSTTCSPQGVLATLTEELLYSLYPRWSSTSHMSDLPSRLGLVGNFRDLQATEPLVVLFEDIAFHLGPFPHVRIAPRYNPVRKKSGKEKLPLPTDKLRFRCPRLGCRFKVIITRKVAKTVGLPFCPKPGHERVIPS